MRPDRLVGAAVLGAATVGMVLGGAYLPTEVPVGYGIALAIGAAVLAAATVGVGVVRPWMGLLLWVAVMPIINAARAEVWLGPIQVIPATLAIVALLIGTLLQAGQAASLGTSITERGPWLVLGLGAMLAVVATLVAPAGSDAANITLHGVLEPMAVFGIVLALRPGGRQILHALLAMGVGVAAAALINLTWLALILDPTDQYEQRMLLARLTYFNVGIFGTMLVMAIPAAAAAYFLRHSLPRPRQAAWFASATLGLMLVALFFTYTKSASLSATLVASLLILMLVQRWRHRIPLLLGVAALLALVVPYPLPALRVVAPGLASGYESFLVALQGEGRVESWDPDTYYGSGSLSIRLEAIGAAAEMTAESPLLGVGPGGFQREFPRIRPDASVPGLQSAHNLLPNLAAEYGLPFALLVGFGLLWAITAACGARRASSAELRVLATTLAISLIGFVSMATLFGVDQYRPYRTMNSDVVTAALLAGLALAVAGAARAASAGLRPSTTPELSQSIDQQAHLGATGEDELAIPRA